MLDSIEYSTFLLMSQSLYMILKAGEQGSLKINSNFPPFSTLLSIIRSIVQDDYIATELKCYVSVGIPN